MTQASPATPATDSRNPPVSFEAFAAALLEPWLTEQALDGPAVSSAREAAARAAYAATVTHAKARGTILVACSDGSMARACMDYLKAYFEDQPQLAQVAKRIDSDRVTLRHGVKILVTTSPRRPRDLLAWLALTHEVPSMIGDLDTRDMARSVLNVCRQGGPVAERIEELLGVEPEALTEFGQRKQAETLTRWEAWRRENVLFPSKASVSTAPQVQPFEMPPVDGEDCFSPEWEQWNAQRKIFGTRPPRVLRERPRRAH